LNRCWSLTLELLHEALSKLTIGVIKVPTKEARTPMGWDLIKTVVLAILPSMALIFEANNKFC
jgi:hypothetical protein